MRREFSLGGMKEKVIVFLVKGACCCPKYATNFFSFPPPLPPSQPIEIVSTTQFSIKHYIALENVLQDSRNCTKLRRLAIAISGYEVPVEPGVQPYYDRPTPIVLSEAETEHFAELENLYRRIGALTNLLSLGLHMVKLNEQRQTVNLYFSPPISFPAMLNLSNAETGRPGFLHIFAGLTMLKTLRGLARANTEETRVTMGWTDATWMDENWPCLTRAELFAWNTGVNVPFLWLLYKRKEVGRVDLRNLNNVIIS
jgi:hypothetical protein